MVNNTWPKDDKFNATWIRNKPQFNLYEYNKTKGTSWQVNILQPVYSMKAALTDKVLVFKEVNVFDESESLFTDKYVLDQVSDQNGFAGSFSSNTQSSNLTFIMNGLDEKEAELFFNLEDKESKESDWRSYIVEKLNNTYMDKKLQYAKWYTSSQLYRLRKTKTHDVGWNNVTEMVDVLGHDLNISSSNRS